MSLRDYFAGQVLVGQHFDQDLRSSIERAATAAYRIADAMLAARVKKDQQP
jgi:hypothetical protein